MSNIDNNPMPSHEDVARIEQEKMEKELRLASQKLQICNTSRETIHIPSRGYRVQGWTIPACPEGKPFSSIVIPPFNDRKVIYSSYKYLGPDVTIVPVPVSAQTVIDDIFNTERLEMRGCFYLDADAIPTEEQVSKARATRLAWLKRLVDAGDSEYKRGGKIDQIPDYCKRAVAELKIKRDWTLSDIPDLQDCPACGDTLKVGVAVCKSCGAILDREKAIQYGLIQGDETNARSKRKAKEETPKENPVSEIGGI